MRIYKNKTGFTLIEIIVTMSIMAILATLVIGGVVITRRQATNTKRLSDAKHLQSILEAYYIKNRTYPGSGSGIWHDFSWCPAIDQNPIPDVYGNCSGLLRLLINQDYISRDVARQNSSDILYCSNGNNSYKLWYKVEPAATYPFSNLVNGNGCANEIPTGYDDLSLSGN